MSNEDNFISKKVHTKCRPNADHAVDQAQPKQNLPGLRFVYSVIYTWSALGLRLRPPVRLHLTSSTHIHFSKCTCNVKRILWIQLVKCTCTIHEEFMSPCHNLYWNVFEVEQDLDIFEYTLRIGFTQCT